MVAAAAKLGAAAAAVRHDRRARQTPHLRAAAAVEAPARAAPRLAGRSRGSLPILTTLAHRAATRRTTRCPQALGWLFTLHFSPSSLLLLCRLICRLLRLVVPRCPCSLRSPLTYSHAHISRCRATSSTRLRSGHARPPLRPGPPEPLRLGPAAAERGAISRSVPCDQLVERAPPEE